jgi:hypothetical protein
MSDGRTPSNPIQALFFILGILFMLAVLFALAGDWPPKNDRMILATVLGGASVFFFVLGTIIHLKH